MSWPKTALLSLSDKRGAPDFARALVKHGARILASGGTAKHLAERGIEVTPIEQWTGFPELLGGRVKTLHPHVHAPILARRSVPADLAELAGRKLEPIDLVAVSLYPFEDRSPALDDAAAVEEIDIGGVALLRAAAKNHADVIVVHDPSQYADVLHALETGSDGLERRRMWAVSAFARTARYDAAISADLARRAGGDDAPPVYVAAAEHVRSLRYGENPHQQAALYARAGQAGRPDAWKEGKELSYNNLLDLDAAVNLVWRFEGPTCVIVKHGQPCGAASGTKLSEAYEAALRCDNLSAYGGIVAFNRALDGETAQQVAKQFVECVAAPEFTKEADEAFKSKKNVRLLKLTAKELEASDPWSMREVGRWVLLQRESGGPVPPWKVVTRRPPSEVEMAGLRFAWEVAAAARSNAIAIARGAALIGLGSGQTSRVDAVDVAIMKARRAGHELKGAALASDGFFPFADNIEHAAQAGVTAIVQPGGSKRDGEVIAACDQLGVAMAFTDRRTFRH